MKALFKSKPLTISIAVVLVICIFFLTKTNSTETIPSEEPEAQRKLDRAITTSKHNIDQAITELENLNDLPDYTNYKKNYILARLYEKKENTEKAILIYEKLLNKNYPLKERVIFHCAMLNTKEGNDIKAIKFFNKLLRDFPYSKSVPQTKYFLAQAQFRLKLNKEAVNTLLSLRSEFPKTQYGIATNYYLGENAYNRGNFNEAIKLWRKYLEESPDGRFAEEISNFVRKSKNISLTSYDYSLLGDVFFHKKDYLNAANYYKISNNPKKYYELGYSLFRTGKKSEAENYLKQFAHNNPKSKNAKWSLYYASHCLPSYLRKSFWAKAGKDIPDLAYYSSYKEAVLEENKKTREHILRDLLDLYPKSKFSLDAAWQIMWDKIQEKEYAVTEEIGKEYFDKSKNSNDAKSETRAKIGFWLGKISEVTKQNTKAIEYYKQTQDILPDNYYSIRATGRLLALTGKADNGWKQISNIKNFIDYRWSIPVIIKFDTLKNLYGACVAELINLQQFDEAIDLIGKSKSPTKRVTSWLKALNSDYENSINIATSILKNYRLNPNSPIWRLAYPLYFWEYILNTCKNYSSLDPLLVCGVIRQESRFDKNALSTSDAYGLMQLIPPTARSISKQININLSSLESLKDPKTNISLGVNYLNGLISDFSNPLFAIAAYNAGPNAVKKWIGDFGRENDLDFFVEQIPYDQTRDYVKKVFSSYWTYTKLYKN